MRYIYEGLSNPLWLCRIAWQRNRVFNLAIPHSLLRGYRLKGRV